MTHSLPNPRSLAPAAFALACAAVYGASFYVAGRLPQSASPGALAVGLTLDLTVVVPLLYYALLVRGRGWPAVTTGLVFVASLIAAEWVVPAGHQSLLRAMQWGGGLVEAGLAGYVLLRAGRTLHRLRRVSGAAAEPDLLTRWRGACRQAFDVRAVADAFAYEAAVLYYAASLLRRAPQPKVPGSFSYHRTNGYGAVVGAILMAALAELAAGHVLLQMWSATAAWVHLALSAYGVVWLLGDFQGMRARPIRLAEGALLVRTGLRWSVRLPYAQIASVASTRREPAGAGPDHLSAVAFGSPQFLIRLHAPVKAEGPYGMTKRVASLTLRVDETAAFEAQLRARLAHEA